MIVDNYATYTHPKVKAWLEKHKRLHMHFTPTFSSWMNVVERFFRDITLYLRDADASASGGSRGALGLLRISWVVSLLIVRMRQAPEGGEHHSVLVV
ncbi:hypothetical protein AZH11_00900 [Pseudomonas simiae]|nr:hypothetical protein AZH11_00900 [Pseudomonas simiae]